MHYDSLNNRLEKKIDTNKVEVQPNVTLRAGDGIVLDSVIKNKYFFKTRLTSYQAPAKNINIRLYYFVRHLNGGFIYLQEISGHPNIKSLSTDQVSSHLVQLSIVKLEALFVQVKGTYTNLNGDKKHNIDEIYSYALSLPKNSGYSTPDYILERELRNFAKKQNIFNY